MTGPWVVLRAVRELATTLAAIARTGIPPVATRARPGPAGRTILDVFPNRVADALLLPGYRGEAWLDRTTTLAEVRAEAGAAYRAQTAPGVTLVLGAGNVTSIAVLDALHALFVDGRACIVKLNPLADGLLPVYEAAFAPLVAAGYLRFMCGDAAVGAALVGDPRVTHVHVTGARATHDALRAMTHKPITSELGGVSPVIVVPGPWTRNDIAFQAEHVATQRLHNGGYNCIGSQVLVLPQHWDRADAFRGALRRTFARVPARDAYYPGTVERRARITADVAPHDVWRANDGDAAPTIVTVSDRNRAHAAFHEEAFGPVLAEIALPATDAASYLGAAVAFANDRLAGTLGATILIHPLTMRALGPRLAEAIAALRYGCIGVNAWSGLGFSLTALPWGGYPGATPDDVRSGIGTVHNTAFVPRPEKSVVYGPFRPMPKPPSFVTHRSARAFGRALVALERATGALR